MLVVLLSGRSFCGILRQAEFENDGGEMPMVVSPKKAKQYVLGNPLIAIPKGTP